MPDTPLSLLERLQLQPNDEAWERLVDMYTPWLQRWLRRHGVAPQNAEDLVQEVLAVLVRELPNFHPNPNHKGGFRSWLRQILVHRVQDFRRRGQTRPVVLGGEDFENMLAELADPDSRLSRRWDQEHDQHVLRELLARVEPEFSARDWMAFRAVTLDGREAAAMAQELGVSVNVVLIAKSRILKRLRQEAKGILD